VPRVVVLGVAQDGGVPHAGCLCRNCQTAREDFRHRHLPVSLGIISGDQAVIVDTTTAFEEQLHHLWTQLPSSAEHAAERYAPPSEVVLTHAHTGHYVGLWQYDRSVLAADCVRVSGPPQTIQLLRANEPWTMMEREGFIRFNALAFDEVFSPLPDVGMRMLQVPHRSEWLTDTAALHLQGPERSVLYIPDIDSWDEWSSDLVEVVSSVDIALLDGCFWGPPVREGVPHPPITETMDRLQDVVDAGIVRVVFTHLNHSNPVLFSGGPEREELERRGFSIANEGDQFAF
jgi:pyrroloquinoline quinone biosynthesis protein B